jgi:hypothetical protein
MALTSKVKRHHEGCLNSSRVTSGCQPYERAELAGPQGFPAGFCAFAFLKHSGGHDTTWTSVTKLGPASGNARRVFCAPTSPHIRTLKNVTDVWY